MTESALAAFFRAATDTAPRSGQSLVRFAKATTGGLLLDGPTPVLLPGKPISLCTYKTGDRVGLILDGARPIVLGVVTP